MKSKRLWLLLAVPAVGVSLYSARYLLLGPALFLALQHATYASHLFPLLPHVAGGVIALSLGPLQFLPGIRRRWLRAHRLIGRAYVGGAILAGLGGIGMVPLSLGGMMAHVGFLVLAGMVLASTVAGLVAILRRRVDSHRAWTMRSYALIFSAVTFRAWIGLIVALHLPFPEAYAVGSWVTPLIDLIVAEWLIGRKAVRRVVGPVATAVR
ncbi:MAG TPA: DUF2306 domain-containing protein [Candidatus Dormibacteraeota bacterium]|jgi:hypothetical protein|nr:DUF2306 domain-containing protein [Candidatus Dormibacteraeota bacterium]